MNQILCPMVLLKSGEQLKQGASAPEFSLKNIDDSTVGLSDLKGKPMVIIFMCNHCPYVKPKMQEIADLGKDYPDVAVIGINANDPGDYPEDDFPHMQEVAKQFGFKYYLVDETQEVAKNYGATCTPDPFVFDKDHKLVFHGRINDSMEPGQPVNEKTMRNVLDNLLAGKEITDWFVPSMGCSIKWKK